MISIYKNKYNEKYSDTHLFCHSSVPLLTNSTFKEEAILYNLPQPELINLIADFNSITGKELTVGSNISELSGGQKIVLMVLLALHSPASRLVFINLYNNLDPERADAIHSLIEKHRPNKQEILIV